MLRLDLTLLTGRYVATSETDRLAHEWPPEPARVFSALVATWGDADEPSADERSALTWLENQSAPTIRASLVDPDHARTVVTYFVPVNDTSVVGLSATTNRAAKLDAIDAELADLTAAIDTDGPTAKTEKKIERLRTQRTTQLDVSTQVAPGKGSVDTAVEMLPDRRGRQARYWPSVTPALPAVTFEWPNATAPAGTLRTLDELAERLTRLGHSSSLVAARFTDDEPSPDQRHEWHPDPDGDTMLRWIQPGQLDALERRYTEHQGSKPRNLPKLGVHYRSPLQTEPVPETPGPEIEWMPLAFADGDRRLPARRAVRVAEAVRGALLRHADEPTPPVLTGHDADGRKLKDQPHISIVPVPYIGTEDTTAQFATGQLLGVVVLVPPGVDDADRRAILRAVATWRADGYKLQLGRLGELRMIDGDKPGLSTLSQRGWSQTSTQWITSSPIALPRHPGNLTKGSPDVIERRWERARDIVADAFEHSGFPRPGEVHLSFDPTVTGAESARAYPAFRQKDRDGRPRTRQLLHAAVRFDEPVGGPMVIGSGRFYGLGLMRPVMAEAPGGGDE